METPDFLFISPSHIKRLRERSHKDKWQPAFQKLKSEAEAFFNLNKFLPDFDSSWYHKDPDKDYEETYGAFHGYIDNYSRSIMGRVKHLFITGLVLENDGYLNRAEEILLHGVEQLDVTVQHHDAGLAYSYIAKMMAEYYCWSKPHLTDDQKELIKKFLLTIGDAILKNYQHWRDDLSSMPFSNHLFAHRLALLGLGITLGNEDWIEFSYQADGGTEYYYEGVMVDGGLCYESSTEYHFETALSLMRSAQLAEYHLDKDHDLYYWKNSSGKTLKNMLDAPLEIMFPNGEPPAVGDCYNQREPLGRGQAEIYEMGYAVYKDPRYAYILTLAGERDSLAALLYGDDEFEKVGNLEHKSLIMPVHGYAKLAGGNSQGNIVTFMTGDYSGIHHQRDCFHLKVFAGDHIWTRDAEINTTTLHLFSDPIQKRFNRTMLAHNLVVVDEKDQQVIDTSLNIEDFSDEDSVQKVSLSDREGRIYPGVSIKRTILVYPEFILDIFWLFSESEHDYDWLVHPRSDNKVKSIKKYSAAILPEKDPYSILKNIEVSQGQDHGMELNWQQEQETFHLQLISSGTGQVYHAEYPENADGSGKSLELYMKRIYAGNAYFVALGQCNLAKAWEIDNVSASDNLQKLNINVHGAGEKREIEVSY